MNCNLFACGDGGYLLTPECMLASNQAQALHGTAQRFLGVLDCALLPDEMRVFVETEVEAHAFAFIAQHAGDQVLAIRHFVRASAVG